MTRRAALLLLALFIVAVNLGAASRQRAVRRPSTVASLTALEWLQSESIAFDTTAARSGLDDLGALRKIVGGARIVSLGEATHGTSEFFTMKHRILEYLVEEMGFTVFAIEAGLPEADAVDDYVLNGTGSAATALAGMDYWTWNTAEVLDMIEWMREYNLRRGDRPPVRFRGFDAQIYSRTVPRVEEYVGRVDAEGVPDVRRMYDCVRSTDEFAYLKLASATRNACAASLELAVSTLTSRRDQYIARSSPVEYEKHLRYATVIVQAESMLSGRPMPRDVFMARNVFWLADVAHPGEKMVLWAHNYHVTKQPVFQMGESLRTRFDTNMVVFGFSFLRGVFNARGPNGLGPHSITESPADGWERIFQQAGKPRFLLDLRNVRSPAAATFLTQWKTVWLIGAVWNDGITGRWTIAPLRMFDVLIYIEDTTASHLLPF
jgi:erythromycin esterase